MVEDLLMNKYGEYLGRLDINERPNSIILSTIVINGQFRNQGIGTKVMEDLINYADENNKIIALTPSPDLGGTKSRLESFYRRFGFVPNKGRNKDFTFREAMIRYPNINETAKPLIKQLLREALITKEEDDLRVIADFTNFSKDYLGIDDDIKVMLAFERTPDLKTTAYYNASGYLVVYAKDRAIVDVCRSIAHELVHHKQNLDGKLKDAVHDGEDGSPIENEANAVAGVIIRKYGRLHPEIYV